MNPLDGLDPEIQLKVFGSWLHHPETAGDVDLLIVYPRRKLEVAHALREEMQGAGRDITMLTEDEEAGSRFADEVGAVDYRSFLDLLERLFEREAVE